MIFTGIEMLFFFLGVITTLSIGISYYYHCKFHFKLPTWISIGTGILLFIFGIAWAISSVLEGEPRAASMGLILFVLPSMVLLVLGRKLAVKNTSEK